MAKDEFIRFRVSPLEKFIIRHEAEKARMTLSDYVCHAALYKRIVVIDGLAELTRELRYEGNNLNQLTVLARQGKISVVNFQRCLDAYEKVWQALSSLQSRAV